MRLRSWRWFTSRKDKSFPKTKGAGLQYRPLFFG
jgi:hypothetical protein